MIAGSQVIGTSPGTVFNTNGTHAMTPSGIVTLTNPQNNALTINKRFGTEAVVGSSTDASGSVFDTFVAIPAPSSGTIPVPSNATLGATFHMADFEITNAQTQQVRSSGMTAALDGGGNVMTFRPIGHSAANGGNSIAGQEFTGTYAVNSDDSGTMMFTAVAGTVAQSDPTLLQSSVRNLYVSATGNSSSLSCPGATIFSPVPATRPRIPT